MASSPHLLLSACPPHRAGQRRSLSKFNTPRNGPTPDAFYNSATALRLLPHNALAHGVEGAGPAVPSTGCSPGAVLFPLPFKEGEAKQPLPFFFFFTGN
jgi:hypothetical protein